MRCVKSTIEVNFRSEPFVHVDNTVFTIYYRGIEWATLKSFLSYSYPKPGMSGLVKNEILLLDIVSGNISL